MITWIISWFYLPQVFVEMLSRGLQAEYKSNGIIIQVNCNISEHHSAFPH